MIPYVIISGLSMLLALFVFSRNIHARLHRYYLLFTIYVVCWLSGAIVERTPDAYFELHYRLLFPFASLMAFYLLLFVSELVGKKWSFWMRFLLSLVCVSIFAFSLLTDYMTESVYKTGFGTIWARQGPLYAPAGIALMAIGSASVIVLIDALRKGVADKHRRQQIKVVLISLIFAFVTSALTSFILPYTTSDLHYYEMTPLSLLVFSFGFAYAILRLKLFNLKAVAARGMAYVLAITGLILVYSLFTNVLAPILSGREIRLSGAEYLSSILTTVVLVLFYPTIKHAFDKFTNSIFFRDTYDPQLFLDQLNKVLVKSIDIDVLLGSCCSLIESNIKVEFAAFFVRDTSYYKPRQIGSNLLRLSESDRQALDMWLPKTRKKVIYIDQFERVTNPYEARVQDILRKNGIEVLVRVVSTLEYEVSGMGYLLIGQKRSGNMFDQQDLRVLEIVGNELEIAVENALRFEEIQQFNITLQNKIEAATKELKHSNEKLKELDQAKDEFVSMASHQLRTPLTAVKGYISMLLDGDAGEATPEQKQMLSQALLSSQRMVHLITDLLNVSRIKTKKFTMNLKSTYLPDVVSSELSQLKESARAKNIKVHFEKPKRFPTLNADEVKLRQVVMNFIDNAIFYTPEGGRIVIHLKNSRYFVEFTVQDTGIGVPKAEQHKLFAKFYRAANARKARPDGTGLGLYMAKKVIAAQGGSIIFESHEGHGSTFGFRLSKSKVEVIEP